MITIRRDGTKIVLNFNPGLFDGKMIPLSWECGSDWYAALLVERCEERLFSMMGNVRRQAYRQGWKDAKAKKGKPCDWFSGDAEFRPCGIVGLRMPCKGCSINSTNGEDKKHSGVSEFRNQRRQGCGHELP